jgi:hypothetical protein
MVTMGSISFAKVGEIKLAGVSKYKVVRCRKTAICAPGLGLPDCNGLCQLRTAIIRGKIWASPTEKPAISFYGGDPFVWDEFFRKDRFAWTYIHARAATDAFLRVYEILLLTRCCVNAIDRTDFDT